MNSLKAITGKKETSEFDVESFPLVQKKKYFGTLEKTRQMCRLFISQGGAFWGAHWWCIFRGPVTMFEFHSDRTDWFSASQGRSKVANELMSSIMKRRMLSGTQTPDGILLLFPPQDFHHAYILDHGVGWALTL